MRCVMLLASLFFGNKAICENSVIDMTNSATERQVTNAPTGHALTNAAVWSPDGEWVVYDVRDVPEQFTGTRIEQVHVKSGEVRLLYESTNGAACGVVTYNPVEPVVVFIHGPENPDESWSYGFTRRRGALVDVRDPGKARPLDAMNYAPPFTPGALRGGSHVHVFSSDGKWVSFTYEDEVLARLGDEGGHDRNLRNIGVSVSAGPVVVKKTHPRSHDGDYFSVVVSRTTANPRPGSDEISKAFEEAWVGVNGYVREDGTRQHRALACQGMVMGKNGQPHSEVFLIDLPEDLTVPGDEPLEGTETRYPAPPKGVTQRRLTYTDDRKYPGIQGPRHWLRSSPDGSQIAFLMKDDDGIVQFWTVSPNGGEPRQVSKHPWSVASAFTWSPDGRFLAHVMDNSVFLTEVSTGKAFRLTPRTSNEDAPLDSACVFSPKGNAIAYARMREVDGKVLPQLFVVEFTPPPASLQDGSH